MVLVPLPRIPQLVLGASFGPALAAASVALTRILQARRRAPSLELAALFNVLAGALVTAMIIVQLAIRYSTAPAADEEVIAVLRPRLWDIVLGLDVSFDVFIGLATLLYAVNMTRDPRFGRVIGGAIGIELARALKTYTGDIRLVSRHPRAVNPGDTPFPADLTDSEAVLKAVEGSETVYLTVGLPYDTQVWQTTWPLVMRNVIDACRTHQARLVFFDNVYMYDPNCMSPMTEETPVNPASKKGAVRADLARMIFEAVERGYLQALIACSADLYGPSITNTSVLTEMVLEKLATGKKANWLGSVKCKHSFTYTPDAGRATALLGNTADAYDQVWHLPTAGDPPTGKQWIEAIAEELGVEPKYRVAPRSLVRVLGLFMPLMKELVEMMYQYDRDYVFDSSKFEVRFHDELTPYLEGIREIVRKDYEGRRSTAEAQHTFRNPPERMA